MIANFTDHTAGVTSVQFHPKEFLLATGSSDRHTLYWDLERFELVSKCGPEASAVRCVKFHPEGTALFSGALDSLRVRLSGCVVNCVCHWEWACLAV